MLGGGHAAGDRGPERGDEEVRHALQQRIDAQPLGTGCRADIEGFLAGDEALHLLARDAGDLLR